MILPTGQRAAALKKCKHKHGKKKRKKCQQEREPAAGLALSRTARPGAGLGVVVGLKKVRPLPGFCDQEVLLSMQSSCLLFLWQRVLMPANNQSR